jgi:hypothetical protein
MSAFRRLAVEPDREPQKRVEFDTKTSIGLRAPADIRSLGGADFCDRRCGKVFVDHHGAQSCHAATGCSESLRF